MTMRVMIIAFAGAVLAAFGAFYVLVPPPTQLNLIDWATPGEADVAQLARDVPYGSAPRQQLDVWAPASRSPEKLPVVVFFYGGGWHDGDRGSYAFAGRAFANQGFVAVVPDYRLVPAVRFPTFLQDCALAVKWARDHAADFGGDPARITLAGHSAGAYNAAMLALDGHFLRDVGVDPKIIRAAALLAGPYNFAPFDVGAAQNAFGAWPNVAQTQPISFARADAPPLLLMQGTGDDTVRPHNAGDLAVRLKAVGAPVALKLYPGKSHNDLVMGLSKPFRGNAPSLADSVVFLKLHSQ